MPASEHSTLVADCASGAGPRKLRDLVAVNFGNALEWFD